MRTRIIEGASVPSHGYTGVAGDVACLLSGLEQQHQDSGWDSGPAILYRISRTPTGVFEVSTARLGGIAHPRDELATAAAIARTDPERVATLEELFDGPPVAHAVIFEGWVASAPAGLSPTVPPREMPGSAVCRFGTAWVGTRRILIQRIKDEDPLIAAPADDDIAMAIGMDASLRDLHLATVRLWESRD